MRDDDKLVLKETILKNILELEKDIELMQESIKPISPDSSICAKDKCTNDQPEARTMSLTSSVFPIPASPHRQIGVCVSLEKSLFEKT